MKLSVEMDGGLMSTSVNDDITGEVSLKTGKISPMHSSSEENSLSSKSNGQNGINSDNLNTSNGKVSPDSGTNCTSDSDMIGFEVESYSSLATPFLSERHSEDELNNLEDNSEPKENGVADPDLDTSHLSEEFQLRLSDEEETLQEDPISRKNSKSHRNDAVTSTTEELCAAIIPEEDSGVSFSDVISRKRTLSESEDSCDSFRSKKLNGLAENSSNSNASNAASETSKDYGQKRPAEVTTDLDSKKLRVCKDDLLRQSSNEAEGESEKQAGEDESPNKTKDNVNLTFLEKNDLLLDSTKSSMPSKDLPFLRKLHGKELSKMSRSDLEELVVQKICEAITERSLVGDLRLRCQALEKRQEKEIEKYNKLRKQMTELKLVMNKYMEQVHSNNPKPPIKVTRSVGLQVSQVFKHLHTHPPNSNNCPPSALVKAQLNKPGTANPLRPDSSAPKAPIQRTPVKITRNQSFSPRSNIVSSTDPPALVPTGSQNKNTSVASKPSISSPSPRIQVPPLQQISGARPRFNAQMSTSSPSPPALALQRPQISPTRPSVPQSANRQSAASNDVEVIDVIPVGVQISNQQHKHQQKQAANAAAQSLASNSGMTVRLVSPTQVSQAGILSSSYPQLVIPSQQKMILTSSSQGSPIRGNLKFLMKSNTGNVLIPIGTNSGATVSSGVVHIPSSTQAAVQQIFTNANIGNRTSTVATVRQVQTAPIHPAPLPSSPPIQASNPAWKQIPPKPSLKIQHQNHGIVLSWNMVLGSNFADIDSYQLYAYQEGPAPPSAGLWKKVGDVKALPLPMACTLTQFVQGHRYHFTVRAVDKHGRVGPFSQQGSIKI